MRSSHPFILCSISLITSQVYELISPVIVLCTKWLTPPRDVECRSHMFAAPDVYELQTSFSLHPWICYFFSRNIFAPLYPWVHDTMQMSNGCSFVVHGVCSVHICEPLNRGTGAGFASGGSALGCFKKHENWKCNVIIDHLVRLDEHTPYLNFYPNRRMYTV